MRRGASDTRETINAAATAIASAENRLPQASVQKRSWWSIYWCFGSHKQSKRIGSAVLFPEPNASGNEALTTENPTQTSSIVFPFIAPPSSPASFLQSPPSATHLTSISANMYSPGGPASIFAIGPYAHETHLVSPPVFSTFTTEPSTAPFTPPPESLHLTTPSSPEVPFARLLGPNGQKFPLSYYEFQSYQLYPGSPLSHLISPCSGISYSGTSSPFPDNNDPHRLLNLAKLSPHEWGSRQGSGSLTPDPVGMKSRDGILLDRQHSDVGPLTNRWRHIETAVDHRVSFEITAEDVVRCVEKKPAVLARAISASLENAQCPAEEEKSCDGEEGQRHRKNRSTTFGSSKEFNFDNADGGNSDEPNIVPDWWANEKALGKEIVPTKDWTFFPMMQPSVS